MNPAALGQAPDLVYAKREGGRYREGIRSVPVSGKAANLELVAAVIQHGETRVKLPLQFRALFYWPSHETASLSVKELEPVYFYQLGDVDGSGWKGPKLVEFDWPTTLVVAKLNYKRESLGLHHLGAVAWVGAVAASEAEVIAPVALYHTHPPARVASYRFVVAPSQRAKLEFRIRPAESPSVVAGDPPHTALAGQPDEFIWTPTGAKDGWYRLEITGYVMNNNDRIERRWRFYHRQTLGKSP